MITLVTPDRKEYHVPDHISPGPFALGHTIEIEDTVYEVVGVRHKLEKPGQVVVSLDTVGKSTIPPPAPEVTGGAV